MSELPRSHGRFHAVCSRLEAMAVTPGPRGWFLEFLVFGFKRGWACLFGGLMLALLLGTHLFWPDDAPLHRYDAITIGAVSLVQRPKAPDQSKRDAFLSPPFQGGGFNRTACRSMAAAR